MIPLLVHNNQSAAQVIFISSQQYRNFLFFYLHCRTLLKSALCNSSQGWETCEDLIRTCLGPEMVQDRADANDLTLRQIEMTLKEEEGIQFSFDSCWSIWIGHRLESKLSTIDAFISHLLIIFNWSTIDGFTSQLSIIFSWSTVDIF